MEPVIHQPDRPVSVLYREIHVTITATSFQEAVFLTIVE